MRSMSVSLFRTTDGLLKESRLLRSGVSFKSMFWSTLSKTKVLFRVLLSRTSGQPYNAWHSVSADLKTRIIANPETRLLYTSKNVWIARLLNGPKTLINRFVLTRIESKVNPKAIIGSTGLSLGLVGVCVKANGPTLMTETDEMETNCQEIRNIFHSYRQMQFKTNVLQTQDLSLDNIEFGSCIAKGCNGVVYSAKLKTGPQVSNDWFAIKMLFNFEAESNAKDVWNALNKECIPFAGDFMPNGDNSLTKRHKLVPHPNIVDIKGVFVDRTPELEGALHLYPDALPIRMGGFARNMTLFIVEKRYDMSLKQYLSTCQPPSHTSLVLLTQLLEGLSFLTKCQITHRDLKTDNILLTFDDNSDIPWLVITDFGFSLTSLSLSFPCDEVCRGGNRALMAPEIIGAQSGLLVRLDYSSSDLWAVGAIAYELFNGLNPFYPYPQRSQCLQSNSYDELQLPEPPIDMPPLIRALILSFLSRNPNKRTQVTTGVNVCHICLHMSPSLIRKLLATNCHIKRSKLVFQWIKTLTMTTLSKRRTQFNSRELSQIEFKLRLLFLCQVKIQYMNNALDFVAEALESM